MTDGVLASWNDGSAKQAILAFVESVTTAGAAFVALADRIAAFDNDGTLWVEQPAPPQFDFIFGTWAKEVEADPSLATKQPYKAIIERDPEFFEGIATQDPVVVATLEAAIARSWKGATPDEFDAQVRDWAAVAKQPSLNVGYTDLVYQPMLELFDLLRANEFRLFVCSGGGREFMRVIAEDLWGIHKEGVIGSAAGYQYQDGKLRRTEELLGGLSLGPGKPEHIFASTGHMSPASG